MSDIDTSELRALLAAATPGPWSNGDSEVSADADLIYDDPRWPGKPVLPQGGPMEVAECYRDETRGERQANAALIAAAVNALPALLDAADERDAAVAEAEIRGQMKHITAEMVRGDQPLDAKEELIADLRARLSHTEAERDGAAAIRAHECVTAPLCDGWPFAVDDAYRTIAAVAWPAERKENRDGWAVTMRHRPDLFEQEAARARERLEAAIAHGRAALVSADEEPTT